MSLYRNFPHLGRIEMAPFKKIKSSYIFRLESCRKHLSRHFTKENKWMANQHMGKKLNIISHQGNKIKIPVRFNSKPSWVARIKMTDHTKDLQRYRAVGGLLCWCYKHCRKHSLAFSYKVKHFRKWKPAIPLHSSLIFVKEKGKCILQKKTKMAINT